jgi:hypothetical protein
MGSNLARVARGNHAVTKRAINCPTPLNAHFVHSAHRSAALTSQFPDHSLVPITVHDA